MAQMTASDLATQKSSILSNVIAPHLQLLATTYYGNSSNNQVIYGELDALLVNEVISQLHVMKSTSDVTTFLQSYRYFANVMNDNPLVYYRLKEASGVSVADMARGMTGTVVGSPTMGVTGPLAVNPDTAITFNGTSQYITLPSAVRMANRSTFTLEAWVKPTNITFTQTGRILANDNPSATNLGVLFAATKNSIVFAIGNGSTFYSMTQAYSFVAGTWYLLAATFSGTSMNLFVNGSQVDVIATPSTLVAQTSNNMYISRNPGDTSNGFPGTIGQAAIYPTALLASRLLAHYTAATSP